MSDTTRNVSPIIGSRVGFKKGERVRVDGYGLGTVTEDETGETPEGRTGPIIMVLLDKDILDPDGYAAGWNPDAVERDITSVIG
jgi:hypothetical protein